MNIIRLVLLAVRAIGRNRLRTFLTMLGIIIGVGSVITMLAIGQGSKNSIKQQISTMGSNMLFVMPGAMRQGPARGAAGSVQTLTVNDAEAIRKNSSNISAVSPMVSSRGQVIYGSKNWSTELQGVGTDYLDIRLLKIAEGVNFSQDNVSAASKVCVIGQTIVDNLFEPGEDPLGKMIRFNRIPFTIIGVLAPKGQNNFGQDQDDLVIAPYTTVQKRILARTHLNAIYVSAKSEELTETAQREITEILRNEHRIAPGQEEDFNVRSQQELLSMLSSTSQLMTVLLASIAGISLLVGGIGIMNIMFVSVTERTREIGLRMAVGAREKDIMRQFLIEAVIVSLTGGIMGMLLGVVASMVVARVAGWPTAVTFNSIALSFAVCAVTGIFFGWYPALKASRLDPIEALRYE